MENQNTNDEVLIRYLLNEVDTAEEAFVQQWQNESESNRLYLANLARTLKLVAINNNTRDLNIEDEWQHFRQLIPGTQQVTTADETIVGSEGILSEMPARNRAKIYRLLFSGAVAASVLMIVLFQFGLFETTRITPVATTENKTVPTKAFKEVWVHEVNTTKANRSFTLPDGSAVQLFPKSEFTYREPSGLKSRQVVLNGKAEFQVAKDKTKPFSVQSSAINTTALGTRFTVTAMLNANHIYVRLNEGKVVVQAVKAINGKKMKDAYLLAGDELIYDTRKGTSEVRRFEKPGANEIESEKNFVDDPLLPGAGKQSWFMFNNQSLSEIFRTLESMYETKINYSKDDISKIYFIGKFSKTDSLEFILNQIAAINKLEVIRENNTYTIKKINTTQ